jgi:hypothetical protein
VADDRLLETVDQPTAVRIIADGLLSGVAARHHVIDGTLKLERTAPWNAQSLDARQTDRPTENKKQSLATRRHGQTASGQCGDHGEEFTAKARRARRKAIKLLITD